MKVQIRDLSLNVLESGVGDPVLLFLHYWGGSARTWRRVIEPLSVNYRCIAYDHRGWGESDAPPEGYTLTDLADDAAALIRALQGRNSGSRRTARGPCARPTAAPVPPRGTQHPARLPIPPSHTLAFQSDWQVSSASAEMSRPVRQFVSKYRIVTDSRDESAKRRHLDMIGGWLIIRAIAAFPRGEIRERCRGDAGFTAGLAAEEGSKKETFSTPGLVSNYFCCESSIRISERS